MRCFAASLLGLVLLIPAPQSTRADCGIDNSACLIGTAGDLDLDGDIDASDVSTLADCITGPGGAPECTGGDLDGDGDADLHDYSLLQEAVTGACTCPPNLTPPQARLDPSTFLGVAPLTVQFDAARTTDAEAVVTGYQWNFGDGAQASGLTAQRTFTVPGTYTVTLTATDAGGLSNATTIDITVSDGTYNLLDPITDNEARRFLWQAAFGPLPADVNFIVQNGYEAWINQQLAEPITPFLYQDLLDHEAAGFGGWTPSHIWDDFSITGADQLRQRVAWSLSQILVMNWEQNSLDPGANIYYYNEYLARAVGNYRDLLGFVTYSHHMGIYLTYMGNHKADLVTGSLPDENFARELQQLFTIGLWQINRDGTYQRDLNGELIPTYDNVAIQQFARVFTGLEWNYDLPWPDSPFSPMLMEYWNHEFGEKQLHDYPGAIPPAGYIPARVPAQQNETTALQDVEDALDNVFWHPNCPPFVSRQLIQRLVTSNPTPAYIDRVAATFEGGGTYGSGVRGDLAAVIKAILLDPEARDPAYRANGLYGVVKEPLVTRWALYRILQRVDRPTEAFPFRVAADPWSTLSDFGQAWMRSPSVFNFYPPDYTPPGTQIADAGFVSPELRIYNDVTAMAIADRFRNDLVIPGAERESARYDASRALAGDPATLVATIDNEIAHGSLGPDAKQIIINAVTQVTDPTYRVRTAVWLIVNAPEFRVLR